MKNKKLTTYQMAVTALMAAALCVLGPLSVPIGAIPISLSNFVICLTAWLLGPKFGTLSVAVYLLIGLVGACIVSSENKILSLGYNGMPIGCSDDEMPWEREGAPLDTKYMYVCHAELNAILNSAHNNLKGARVYVTLFPCNECTKAIIQSGIAEVVYYGDKYHDSDSSVAARFMFKKAGVKLTAYQSTGRKAELEL